MSSDSSACPCGSGQTYAHCCEPRHLGQRPAETAEALMRSRYSAYVQSNAAYVLATWHASTRPASLDLAGDSTTRWLGLKIVRTQAGEPTATQGQVEFIARYKIHGKAHRLHELSRFVQEEGVWYYVDGEPRS
ncbi:MAG: YchJ family protein [Gammaproteobacteria bacterium]